MCPRNHAQAPDIALVQCRYFHAQRITIRLVLHRPRLFATGVSAFACFPNHCYLQPNLLILLTLVRNVIILHWSWVVCNASFFCFGWDVPEVAGNLVSEDIRISGKSPGHSPLALALRWACPTGTLPCSFFTKDPPAHPSG